MLKPKTQWALCTLLLIASIAGYTGLKIGEFYQAYVDLKDTRINAVNNSCGQYNSKTGIFEWVKPRTIEDIFLDDKALMDKPEAPKLKKK